MSVPWSVYTSTCSHCLCTPLASWRDPDRATQFCICSFLHTHVKAVTHRSQAASRRLIPQTESETHSKYKI